MATDANIYQFKITLKGMKPKIWRRIQVPATFNFYALHSAIVDAMGWRDVHLHKFEMENPRTGDKILIGTPSPDGFEERLMEDLGISKVSEQNARIAEYFVAVNDKAVYEYDFGAGWEHEIVLEKILLSEAGVKYPRCIAGKRACPLEDCGEDEELSDPDEFDPKAIEFKDAEKRENFF